MTQQGQAGSVIGSDVLCRSCGYNLRGLTIGGRCPECAEDVGESIRRDEIMRANGVVPLEMASPWWMRRVWLGCLSLLAGGLAHGLYNVIHLDWILTSQGPTRSVVPPLVIALWIAAPILITAGAWLIGTPEPGAPEARFARGVRRTLRTTAVLELALHSVPYFLPTNTGAAVRWIQMVVLLMTAVASVITWAGMMQLAGVARRAGRPVLQRWALFLTWGIPAVALARLVLPLPATLIVTPQHAWSCGPTAMLGNLTAAVLLPYSLYVWPRWNGSLAWWLLTAATSVSAVVVVACMLAVLWGAIRARNTAG